MLKVTAYGDRVSLFPGETLNVMVNCEAPSYRARVVRIIHGDNNPIGPGVKLDPVKSDIEATYKGRPQTIHAGSFGIVGPHEALDELEELTLTAIVQPTLVSQGEQGIVTKWDESKGAGFALYVDDKGCLAFRAGDGSGKELRIAARTPLMNKAWYKVAVSISRDQAILVQTPVDPYSGQRQIVETMPSRGFQCAACPETPLLFAAFLERFERERPIGRACFNGKIEAPAILRGALSTDELKDIHASRATMEGMSGPVACWDFSRDISSTKLTDVSLSGLHGSVVNMPTRAVVGHRLPLDTNDWRQAPQYWGAIHFHDDDVYDAGWQVDFSWTVPTDLRSGIYGIELTAEEQTQFVVCVVRAAPEARKSRLLYLFPLATYMAYANEHFGTNSALVELHLNRATVLHPHQVFLNEHREYGHSMYDLHSDGSGVYYSSRLRPVLNMQPYIESNHGARPSNLWQFNADTHITDWLEAQGFEFDVATDEDLHREGLGLLQQYSAVMTSTHPEYYSARMWDALYDFIHTGGRLIYMGGNGFYWRVAFHDEIDGIMEVRRAEGGSRAWEPPTGEYYHSFTGEYGGMWRRQGNRAPNAICGVGFIAQGFDESAHYLRKPGSYDARAAFIFEGIGDEKIGDFGLIGGGAAGMEVDSYNPEIGSPVHALVLASSDTMTEAHVLVVEEMLFNFMGTTGNLCPQVKSDLVFYETVGGGAVFSAGSIAWAGALSHNSYDNNVSRLVGNVVRRFIDSEVFGFPEPNSSS
ncbi:LamG domain-containing protein [Mesorhizobium sp. B2-4-19]|uniref:N,N-dimethylformamidase beta subunit family domain-containing protein n=1 Tax=Mesorhizobium sp. B2-4-19 TaxID=2589930 RepID=UPI001127541E|nr:N,N-dimethylformamidase beta subunit family domain-containing protein [Mesorhizobium sp. B2-4-19]TPK59107.1 LamG domain-containing protein [Mesorhizobium sp. B2-4-19]